MFMQRQKDRPRVFFCFSWKRVFWEVFDDQFHVFHSFSFPGNAVICEQKRNKPRPLPKSVPLWSNCSAASSQVPRKRRMRSLPRRLLMPTKFFGLACKRMNQQGFWCSAEGLSEDCGYDSGRPHPTRCAGHLAGSCAAVTPEGKALGDAPHSVMFVLKLTALPLRGFPLVVLTLLLLLLKASIIVSITVIGPPD